MNMTTGTLFARTTRRGVTILISALLIYGLDGPACGQTVSGSSAGGSGAAAPAAGAPAYGAPAYSAPGYGGPAYGASVSGAPSYAAPPAYGAAASAPPSSGAAYPGGPAPLTAPPGSATAVRVRTGPGICGTHEQSTAGLWLCPRSCGVDTALLLFLPLRPRSSARSRQPMLPGGVQPISHDAQPISDGG